MNEKNENTLPTQNLEEEQATLSRLQGLLPQGDQLYFDAVVHIAVGPFVAKISFARFSPADNSVISTTTVTVPLSVLTDLATNISNGFKNPKGIAQLADVQQKVLAQAKVVARVD